MFNRYIVVPFVVWAIAQFLKFIISAFKGRVDFKYLYASGGMPSVHSAVVMSLTTTALLVDGVHSAIFGFTAIFAAIVMYDSFGVRRSSGEQAIAINAILDSLGHDHPVHGGLPPHHLRELLGHKPKEVVAGAILGVVLACVFSYDKIQGLIDAMTTPVTNPYIYALAVVSVLTILIGLYMRILWRKRSKKIAEVKTASRVTSWTAWLFGLVGLILAAAQYEDIEITVWALWPVLLIAVGLLTAVTLVRSKMTPIAVVLLEEEATNEKEKWFEGPNKKKRAKAARSKKRK